MSSQQTESINSNSGCSSEDNEIEEQLLSHDKPLPQPQHQDTCDIQYEYIPYGDISAKYFPSSQAYPENTLCWVLKSKGNSQKKHTKKDPSPGKKEACNGEKDNANNGHWDEDTHTNKLITNSSTSGTSSCRTELFLRARVVCDDNDDKHGEETNSDIRRVLVRYPKGSTYRVRRSNVIPVLEGGKSNKDENIVIVVPETHLYRRLAAVHTCVGESFLEIGCDFGKCTDRVRRVLTEFEGVPSCVGESLPLPSSSSNGESENHHEEEQKLVAIGIDKSDMSIDIAKERYPDTYFSVEDALTDSGVERLQILCRERLLHGCPSVVAIDINGTRELPAVLQCIQNVMNASCGFDGETSCDGVRLPRLIIVKSRTLYKHVTNRSKPEIPA